VNRRTALALTLAPAAAVVAAATVSTALVALDAVRALGDADDLAPTDDEVLYAAWQDARDEAAAALEDAHAAANRATLAEVAAVDARDEYLAHRAAVEDACRDAHPARGGFDANACAYIADPEQPCGLTPRPSSFLTSAYVADLFDVPLSVITINNPAPERAPQTIGDIMAGIIGDSRRAARMGASL